MLTFETSGNVAFFDGFAFVIFFLAFASGNDELDVTPAGEKFDWNELEAALLGALEAEKLFFGDEELEIALGIGTKSEIVEP